MKKLYSVPVAAFAVAALLLSASAPAYALGGCEPNRHRNPFGFCVFGGQNQGSCLRRTGHVATRLPNGVLVCQ